MSERETSRIYQMKIEDLYIKDGFNVRIDTPESMEELHSLAKSIAARGILEPLTVFAEDDGTAYVENGHRRMMAVEIANAEYGADIKTVPARFESKFVSEIDRTENLLVRASGKPLTMLEQAEVVKRLLTFGRTEEAIADHCVCSITHIKNLVILAAASDKTRDMVINGTISATNAVESIRKFGAKAEEVLVEALTMVDDSKKQKVTRKQLGKKNKIDWKIYGPKLQEILFTLLFSAGTDEVRKANEEDAKELLREIEGLLE